MSTSPELGGQDPYAPKRQLQLVVPQPRPGAPRSSVRPVATVSMMLALAVIALYRFANTPPAPALQLASASATRVVDAAPADQPAGPAAAQPAATSPTEKVSALAQADTRSPAAEPQASELRRTMSPQQRQAMASLVARGKELLRSGDFSSARLILQRAADAGEADAALTLGCTYDPNVLAQFGIRSDVANVASARTWYEKAQALGSTEASKRLATLPNR